MEILQFKFKICLVGDLSNRSISELQGREITDGDYEALLSLDRAASPDAPGVPEHILNLIPCHRVGANRRLLREGVQCRLCLQPYQPEDYVKKLPKCNHYFHRDCIDTWLQNHRGNIWWKIKEVTLPYRGFYKDNFANLGKHFFNKERILEGFQNGPYVGWRNDPYLRCLEKVG